MLITVCSLGIKQELYLVHKAPTFVVSRRGHGSLTLKLFFLERLIPRLEPVTYHFMEDMLVHQGLTPYGMG